MRLARWSWMPCVLLAIWCLGGGHACVPQLCGIDFTCQSPTPHCLVGRCVACLRDADCPVAGSCRNGACVSPEGLSPEPPIDTAGEQPVVASDGAEPAESVGEPGGETRPSESLPDGHEMTPPEERGAAEQVPTEQLPEPQPACTDGETRPCYTLQSGCTRGPGGAFQCKAPCQAGTQVCTNQLWPKACSGQRGPGEPLCDNSDRDCDGKPDLCKAVAPTDQPLDYAINDSGHLLALTFLSTEQGTKTTLKVHCADSILYTSVPKTLTLVTAAATSPSFSRIVSPRIIAVPGKSFFYVAWTISMTSPTFTSTMYVHTIDVNCQLRPAPKWQIPFAQNFSIATDASARVGISYFDFRTVNGKFVSSAYLALYDAAGKQTFSQSLKTATEGCVFAGHIAINQKGLGFVACRNSVAPFLIRVHRFSMPGTIFPSLTIADSGGTSSVDAFFLAGINEKSELAVQWQDNQQGKSFAYFRNAAGLAVTRTIPAKTGRTTMTSVAYAFQSNAQIAIVGDDFVLQDMPPSMTGPGQWFRYNAAGSLVKQISNPAFPSSLRYWGDFAYFLLPTTHIIFRVKQPF